MTARKPTEDELAALLFAWRVCKHVKSNAIVYARNGQMLSAGAGQTSRVDAAKFGAMKAVLPLDGSRGCVGCLLSLPRRAGGGGRGRATAVIQPGGSVKDPEVIAAADRLGMAMVFTGVRHFRH